MQYSAIDLGVTSCRPYSDYPIDLNQLITKGEPLVPRIIPSMVKYLC
jgi:hypothetical protein